MGHPGERRLSWDEYLALERETGVKHEYVDGYVYAMSGGTPTHARLAARLTRVCDVALDGKPCATFTSDLKVWMPPLRTARYPDLSIVCGPLAEDPNLPATTRPTVLFEVLSPSTERFDGGIQFDEYTSIATLQDYVLVSTTAHAVTHWHRDADGRWVGARLGPEDTLTLGSVGVSVPVAEIYRGVPLDARRRAPLALEP